MIFPSKHFSSFLGKTSKYFSRAHDYGRILFWKMILFQLLKRKKPISKPSTRNQPMNSKSEQKTIQARKPKRIRETYERSPEKHETTSFTFKTLLKEPNSHIQHLFPLKNVKKNNTNQRFPVPLFFASFASKPNRSAASACASFEKRMLRKLPKSPRS